MELHVTNSTMQLASAMAVVKAGTKVVLDPERNCIENKLTKEGIKLIEVGGTFVFDIKTSRAYEPRVLPGGDDLSEPLP